MSVEIQMFTAIVAHSPVHQRIVLMVTLLITVEPFFNFEMHIYFLMSGSCCLTLMTTGKITSWDQCSLRGSLTVMLQH